MEFNIKSFISGILIALIVFVGLVGVVASGKSEDLSKLFNLGNLIENRTQTVKLLSEESAVIDVAENVSPSVVTVTAEQPARQVLDFDPFGMGLRRRIEGGEPEDIGSGFIVSEDGLIITNRHVVSDDTATYKVVTKDDQTYDVKEISKDPLNDIAILKIDASNLKPVTLGDSSNLKVGQFAIAIGTALGEFRHTVTTGVVSGLGRGIIAGSVFEGYVEKLENVIQTDAAINPGNSGGPLLDSSGEVIGVNVAVAQGAQNVGFAIPINIVKDRLSEFKSNGKFAGKTFLGVQYQMISERSAITNEVPEGAYIVEVVSGSPAEKVGVQVGDIITKFDGQSLDEDKDLSELISSKKPGDTVQIELWDDDKTRSIDVELSEYES